MSRRRRILLSLCAAVALFGAWVVWLRHRDAQSRVFDAAVWREARGTAYVRGRMIPDLLARHRLEGMTRAQIVALLGPPGPQSANDRFIYNLGYPDDDPLPIDPYLLTIEFDAHGIAVRHAVVQG